MSYPAPWPQAPPLPPPPSSMGFGNPSPAYNAVSARRAFAQPAPPAAASAPTPEKKGGFPPEVRAYVGRCFEPENAIPGITKPEIETKLKHMITEHMNNGTIYTVDWAHIPVAQCFIVEDRKRQDAYSAPPESSEMADRSRKRKSENGTDDSGDGDLPPWRKNPKTNAFEDRISYSSKSQADRVEKRTKKRQEELRSQNESKYQEDLRIENRRKRFGIRDGDDSPDRSTKAIHHSYADDVDMSNAGPVIGTNLNIEKRYLRLTAPPKPESVRPLPVLRETLEYLKRKWRQENKYIYICDQFKSLRQDLTVQHIKTDFTVTVYETHARIALEQGDLGEYNQCQTQLRALYRLGLAGHPAEFLAYRILYFIHTCNRTDMNDVLADLTEADKKTKEVKHALDVRSASALGNYHRFFRLYLEAPNMGAYLMDMFISRERLAALTNICKAYKPDVKVRFLTEELGFESDQECVQFLCDYNGQALLLEANGVLKLATGKVGNLFESAKAEAFRKVDLKGQL